MDFDDIYMEFQQYYTMYLNETIIKVKENLKIILTQLIELMHKEWENEVYNIE